MWPKITKYYSPNFNLPKRTKIKIKFILIHYTGMKNENDAIKKLCDENKKVSAHYFIKKNGEIINLVPDLYEAWHAGKSNWHSYNSLNRHSIGIEIHNPGHMHGYKNFSNKQIDSVKFLLRKLIKKYKVSLKNVLGHSDVAPDRKKDPGEKFPWKYLAKHKLSIWHKISESYLKKERKKNLDKKDRIKFIKDLQKIGYKKIKKFNVKSNDALIIKAFQRRFRQSLINGIPDKECFLITKNLLK